MNNDETRKRSGGGSQGGWSWMMREKEGVTGRGQRVVQKGIRRRYEEAQLGKKLKEKKRKGERKREREKERERER